MKIVHPHKITGQLLDVILEAEKELVIVSPYVNLRYWQKPVAAIQQAVARGVKVDFYIRLDHENATSKEQVEKLGITPILVENLHAKIYYNEKDGIITSMNLLHSSDSNSIEIGCQVETADELDELRRIVQKFLGHYKPPVLVPIPVPAVPSESKEIPFDELLTQFLARTVDGDAYAEWEDENELSISALRNGFTLSVGSPSAKIVLEGIISQREANRYAKHSPRHLKAANMIYKLVPGDLGHYTVIRGTFTHFLTNRILDDLPLPEKERLMTVVAEFIRGVRAFKDDYQ